MGKRLHIAKRYVVEYSGYCTFNWQSIEFHDLLTALDMAVCGEAEVDYPDSFEVSKEEWASGMDRLRRLEELEESDRAEIEKALEALERSGTEMLAVMERYLSESDPEHPFREFSCL